eukprot:CAMPEP_0172175246 /NCGR_PEP_ID=MMETSP1050-20130122/14114_1 /TAXON_ID=233186 /ORGANISM="Cryptomonas curvata, Strain CCAP979/52" /LENGTH=219 /DNA_ID=CAMNT_0012847313 /DNA_START=548 /DNA_END=1207 /DNA_ORIENTATION=+
MDELEIDSQSTIRNASGSYTGQGDISFWKNRDIIAEAYRTGDLHGLAVTETDEMYRQGALDPIFVQSCGSDYLLPCFCVTSRSPLGKQMDILWTHPRARGRRLATHLLRGANVSVIDNPLEKSLPFWRRIAASDVGQQLFCTRLAEWQGAGGRTSSGIVLDRLCYLDVATLDPEGRAAALRRVLKRLQQKDNREMTALEVFEAVQIDLNTQSESKSQPC